MLENNAPWVSQVAQDVINACVQHSKTCESHLDSLGHIPRLVMDSIMDGSLPCLQRLPWLDQSIASYYAGFMTLNKPAHVLQGPFWWRLYRCSDTDVAQLNAFHAYKQAHDVNIFPPEYAYGLAITIGSSELYTNVENTDMSYEKQVERSSKVFADATPQLVVSLAREVLPLYHADPSIFRKFARPSAPVLISVGSLDPNTPHGLALWFANGLGESAFVVTIPYAAHGTLAYDAPCSNSIILGMLFGFGQTRPDTSCLADIEAPDFDGHTNSSQAMSAKYFGTSLLWNEALPPPPTPSPPSPAPHPASSSSSKDKKYLAAIGVLVALVVLIAIAAVFQRRSRAAKTSEDLSSLLYSSKN